MAVVSGGTTLIDNGALDAGVSTGSLVLLSTQTASASATIDFTSGIDSTYDVYVFKFINIHPSTGSAFTFQGSTNTGSSYGVTITSTSFRAYHYENDSSTALEYRTANDLAQSTSFQKLSDNVQDDNDTGLSGYGFIYNPSSTTFVKHFMFNVSLVNTTDIMLNPYTAGYFNTTSSIDAIQFKMASGNIDSGTIKMYGIK